MFFWNTSSPQGLVSCRNWKSSLLAVVAALGVALACPADLSVSAAGKDPPKKKKTFPAPNHVKLSTKDGVVLACTYFPATKEENKEANIVPVILIHGWNGVGGEFNRLALYLQSLGHAVIVPDLRGHGESVRRRDHDRDTVRIDLKRMRPEEIAGMYLYDVEAVKTHLLEEHNQGKLNIELLTIVGTELGAIVAANWAVLDWSWPILPSLKQGQDVKALVLVSPKQALKGLKMQPAYRHENVRRLPTLVLVGTDDRRAYSDAKRMHSKLKRFHAASSRNSRNARGEDVPRTLFLAEFPTSLQGTKLLDARVSDNKLSPHEWIGRFINFRVVSQKDVYGWKERGSPTGG